MLAVISLETLKGIGARADGDCGVETGELTMWGVDNILSVYLLFHSFCVKSESSCKGTIFCIFFIFLFSPPLCIYVESFLC